MQTNVPRTSERGEEVGSQNGDGRKRANCRTPCASSTTAAFFFGGNEFGRIRILYGDWSTRHSSSIGPGQKVHPPVATQVSARNLTVPLWPGNLNSSGLLSSRSRPLHPQDAAKPTRSNARNLFPPALQKKANLLPRAAVHSFGCPPTALPLQQALCSTSCTYSTPVL